jgi:pyrimidine-nucleoside phosphorylase
MSKKIASGAKGIVLDVKVGEGAFMRELESARELARIMVGIGTDVGRDVIAVISDMNQPLGNTVGNALELKEALDTLNGGGPADLREHCLEIAKHMVMLAGRGDKWTDEAEVEALLAAKLDEGKALLKFRDMVVAQGGDVAMIDDPSLLPQAPVTHILKADREGYVSRLSADLIGLAAMRLGAGREAKGDPVNHAVGLEVHVRVGDHVANTAPLITVNANTMEQVPACVRELRPAVEYSDTPVDPLPLHYDVIRAES